MLGGSAALPPGRTLTQADVAAIAAAIALVKPTRISADDVGAIADELEARAIENVLSHASIHAVLLEPMRAMFWDEFAVIEARPPSQEALAVAVAILVVPRVLAELPTAGPSAAYQTMSPTRMQEEVNKQMTTRTMRRIDVMTYASRMSTLAADPRNAGDLVTFLVAQALRTDDSNKFTLRKADRWTFGSMRELLKELHAIGSVPEAFRDWLAVNVDDSSVRHTGASALTQNLRHDGRADGRPATSYFCSTA